MHVFLSALAESAILCIELMYNLPQFVAARFSSLMPSHEWNFCMRKKIIRYYASQ